MKKIAVFCCAGMSTSLLVKKMNEAIKKRNLEIEVNAYSENDMVKHTDVDIVLLGPQIQYLLAKANGIFGPYNIPVKIINSVDYGMMNGDKILDFSLKLMK